MQPWRSINANKNIYKKRSSHKGDGDLRPFLFIELNIDIDNINYSKEKLSTAWKVVMQSEA